jgi:hypothetical protein
MTLLKIIYERGLIECRDGINDCAPFDLYRLRREDGALPPVAKALSRVALRDVACPLRERFDAVSMVEQSRRGTIGRNRLLHASLRSR